MQFLDSNQLPRNFTRQFKKNSVVSSYMSLHRTRHKLIQAPISIQFDRLANIPYAWMEFSSLVMVVWRVILYMNNRCQFFIYDFVILDDILVWYVRGESHRKSLHIFGSILPFTTGKMSHDQNRVTSTYDGASMISQPEKNFLKI
jgi:hypothetical protein